MATDYEQAHAKYRALAKAASGGDAKAKEEKAKVMQDIRNIERDAARAGTKLSATYKVDKIEFASEECRSKRSLQEEYIAKFDKDKKVVNLAWQGKPVDNLNEYHSKRLLGK